MTRSCEAFLIPDGQGPSGDLTRRGAAIALRVDALDWTGRIIVQPGSATLGDIVPVAAELASSLGDRLRRRLAREGRAVSCQKGCPACCKNLVPLSPPEAFRMVADIDAMPKPQRRRVLLAFASAARCVVQSPPPRLGLDLDDDGAEAPEAVGQWYGDLNLTCPLLGGDLCDIYPRRPIACREHLVRQCPLARGAASESTGEVMAPPVSVAEALGRLAADVEGREIEAVVMPLAPAWVAINGDRGLRVWPAVELFERFGAIVNAMAAATAKAA